ncbi:MAG: MBL fold metallo-hydrolase [Acidobacteria bacterium]|nr:MBL fold metallo-hydrolase [Acidobacteriota bacterium]
MYFKQFYLGCLAHASYLIGSEGEAVVVDPQRDVKQYLDEAVAQGFNIKYVIETHLHADFVSGHRELAKRTGAEIVFGWKAGAQFPHRAAKDGDELLVGKLRMRVLETPGHTPESICLLVIEDGVPVKVLTGDTLFIGDVGRPDLVGSKGYTPEQMAAMMYDSLHEKLLTLDDAVEVYPAHGAGSLCGKNMSKETSSTIGQQRRFNYALQPMMKKAFVNMMTADLPEAPAYFPKDAEINRTGAATLADARALAALTPAKARALADAGAVVLDVRDAESFGAGHVPGSLNIGLGGQFASWAGILIPIGSPIVILADDSAQVEEAALRLARVGHETIRGFLNGGVLAWHDAGFEIATVTQITVNELKDWMEEQHPFQLIDVRRPTEYAAAHAPGTVNAPLAQLESHLTSFDPARSTVVICAGGYRSSAGTSILERKGYKQVYNVIGGTGAWINAGYPTEGEGATASCQK